MMCAMQEVLPKQAGYHAPELCVSWRAPALARHRPAAWLVLSTDNRTIQRLLLVPLLLLLFQPDDQQVLAAAVLLLLLLCAAACCVYPSHLLCILLKCWELHACDVCDNVHISSSTCRTPHQQKRSVPEPPVAYVGLTTYVGSSSTAG
jgi:hypothetical protein